MKKLNTYVKSINATLRNYRRKNMSNYENTLIERAKKLGLTPKQDKKGNVYFSERKTDIEKYATIKGVFERISKLSEKSKISSIKERLKKENPNIEPDIAMQMSEELTNFIKDYKYELYAIDTGINDAGILLNEMDSGHLDLLTAYNAMKNILKTDELLKNNEILLNRKSEFKVKRL